MLALAWLADPLAAQPPSAADLPPAITATGARYVERVEAHAPPGAPAIAIRFLLRPETSSQADRLVDTVTRALDLFTEWFGPYPATHLIVVDAPWRAGLAGAAYPWGVVTSTRWIAVDRDGTAERFLAAAIARAFWPATEDGDPTFNEGLRLYVAARGVHALLEGRNFATPRAFGAFVPLPRREVPVSMPPANERAWNRRVAEVVEPADAPWRSATAAAGGDADRASAALQSLERYIGWPAMEQALRTLRARHETAPSRQAFAAIVSAQRGGSLDWFFDAAFDRSIRYDYGVDALVSGSAPAGQALVTVVGLRRYGDGVFGGADRPSGGGVGDGKPLPVVVAFADGERVEMRWDGRANREELTFEGRAPAAWAAVDPDGILQLDADRSNNRRSVAPAAGEPGTRLSAYWWIWLQDLMLTCTGLA